MNNEQLFSRTERYNIVVDITPEIAKEWLTHYNTHNRKRIDSHVEYLANEMTSGRWRLTHQGIAFSSNRVLLDGQNRLWAVIVSGVTVPMRVFFNEPTEAMEVLDTGQRRRSDQILTLSAWLGEITHVDIATLRAMFIGWGNTRRRSPGEEGQLLSQHLRAVRFAQEILHKSSKLRNVATATTRAVLARAWYSADHVLLRHFAEVLSTGRPIGEHDEPILLLFQFLIAMRSRGRTERYECYRKTERALRAFLDCEQLSRLYAAPHELFPLPEESDLVRS